MKLAVLESVNIESYKDADHIFTSTAVFVQAFSCINSTIQNKDTSSDPSSHMRLDCFLAAPVRDVGFVLLIRGQFPLFVSGQSHIPEWTEEQAGLCCVRRVQLLWDSRYI